MTSNSSNVVMIEVTGGGLKDPKTALGLAKKPIVVSPELGEIEKFLIAQTSQR
jgi:hypothetical protein